VDEADEPAAAPDVVTRDEERPRWLAAPRSVASSASSYGKAAVRAPRPARSLLGGSSSANDRVTSRSHVVET
jgi:hypothetical protein